MYLLLLLPLVVPFLTIDVTDKDKEKVIVNVPMELAEVALEYAKEHDDEGLKINDEEIDPDSLLEILKQAEISNEPILEVEKNGEIIRFWIRDGKDIVKKTGRPKRLIIDVKNEDDNVYLRVPLWLVRILPSIIIATGEDADDIREAKKLIRETLKYIRKLDGGFNLVEVQEDDEKVRIAFE